MFPITGQRSRLTSENNFESFPGFYNRNTALTSHAFVDHVL
jgi:hypothetical protein